MPFEKHYYSKDTKIMIKILMQKYIKLYAAKFDVPVALIRAICKVESDNNIFAVRIEHHLKKAKWYQQTLFKIDQVEDYHYCSFGLMQVMYGNARHMGFLWKPFALCNPKYGLKYGIKHLGRQIKRYKGNLHDAISAYNQGNNRYYDVNKNGIKDKNEKYRNQDYVNKVKVYFDTFSMDPDAVV